MANINDVLTGTCWSIYAEPDDYSQHDVTLYVGADRIKTCIFDPREDAEVKPGQIHVRKDLSQCATEAEIVDLIIPLFMEFGLSVKGALVEGGAFTSRTVIHLHGRAY